MPGILEPTGNGNGHGPSNHFVPIEDSALFTETPVLIVGGVSDSPQGSCTIKADLQTNVILLVKSILIEKYVERLAAPKVHALSPRSLEICRQFGLDTNLLRKIGTPRDEAYWVNFLVNLSRERIGTLPYERMDAAVLDCTPEMIHNIPQPKFEQFIADQLQNDPNVIVRKNVAFIKCSQTPKDITSIVEERSTKVRWQIKSRHLLACDGARSEVRKDLAIESEGEDGYETMMTIHFEANLAPIVRERLGMLHWITDPACSGFIITYDLRGDHVLISNFDSEKYKAESWTQQLARSTVSAAIGQDVPFEVESFRPWVLSRKVAKHYRQGRAFLIGDAAHSFPPTGGLGLNSGIADAHNIAYKLAAVHYGWARSSILDSFEGDRRQVALVNSAQSVKNGKQIFSFIKSLGTAGVQDEQEARENLHRLVHGPRMRGKIAEEVEAQREHFDNLELHIGYVYGDNRTPPNASKFSPKFVPSARLPHA
ncbi:2,4-dichlorophenol 6-monooxygenase [Colletotrichum asianum]|uniref:2,4-dichlorophenol 6-monooxygenase n=1 Tax=Colletotrichum asianum TaxID=702518 RepID=A0A8H3ZMZ5_9PEZI|nr:2,4-dichlorophenol 6-monooxygenase [Colletotrichum asianum]